MSRLHTLLVLTTLGPALACTVAGGGGGDFGEDGSMVDEGGEGESEGGTGAETEGTPAEVPGDGRAFVEEA